MTQDRWKQIKLVLEHADQAPPADRGAVLDRFCAGDAELRREVEALLEDDGSGAFLSGAIAQAAAEWTAEGDGRVRFGRYQLIHRIGQGGMGAVYEAVRVDDFEKKVALKIVKQELDSDYARTRFQHERQVLATLEHPYIARLLDGGETDRGIPYLVLEYVDGIPIDRYCEPLDRRARLHLFLKVCEAVEYAHRNLVIHRDLKPANVLVTADGNPKLLDFGIAKLLDPQATATQTMMMALTPEYASPEQARGEAISTASDVYSLGVVLYQLLTGRKPYKLETTTAMGIAQAICEQTPDAPRLGDELDHILLMALRKEPARRYPSVRQMAEDLERYLEHRPVMARPDTVFYRTAKFVRRNRTGVGAAFLVTAALAAGFLSTWRAERRANARFNEVRQLATHFLFDFDRDIRQLPGATAARERLVNTALEHLDGLLKEAGGDSDLVADIAQAYVSVGDVLGNPGLPSLGHVDRARQNYEKACALMSRLVARNSPASNPYRARACAAHTRLGYLLLHTGQSDEAERRMREGLAYVQPKIDAGLADANDYRAAANGHAYLETLYNYAYRARAAGAEAAQCVDLMRKYQSLVPGLRPQSDLARSIAAAAQAAAAVGELEQAEKRMLESDEIRLAIARQSPADVENRRELAVQLSHLAEWEFQAEGPSLQHFDAARKARQESLRLYRELVSDDPRNATAKHGLALELKEMADLEVSQDPKQAETDLREGLRIVEELPPGFHERDRHTGLLLAALSGVLRKQGRLDEARAALHQAAGHYAADNPSDARAGGDFLRLWEEQGDYARTWEALTPTIAAAREDITVAFELADCAVHLAVAEARQGHADAANEWKRKAAAIWTPWKGRFPAADRQLDL